MYRHTARRASISNLHSTSIAPVVRSYKFRTRSAVEWPPRYRLQHCCGLERAEWGQKYHSSQPKLANFISTHPSPQRFINFISTHPSPQRFINFISTHPSTQRFIPPPLKIGRKKAHDTYDLWPHLRVKRSKVKVIRSQVKIALVSKGGTQLVWNKFYKHQCRVSLLSFIIRRIRSVTACLHWRNSRRHC